MLYTYGDVRRFCVVVLMGMSCRSCRKPCFDWSSPCHCSRTSVHVQTLEYFSLSGINKWAYVGYESLFFVGFFFAAWAALQFIRYDKR